MAATIDDLRNLGYEIGIAHGDVATEEAALEQARADADPGVIVERANVATTDTLQTLANIGKLPETAADRLELAAKIGAAALEQLTEHVNGRVDFHERALALAKEMPDVWHVAGPGFSGYVACKADGTGWDEASQDMLDTLTDPAAHAEREFQVDNPAAMAAADTLTGAGATVERELGASTFTVDGKKMSCAALVAAAAATVDS